MHHIAIRAFLADNLADVFIFKSKRQAMRWIEEVSEFWRTAINRKQVRVEYIGATAMPCGVVFARPSITTYKLSTQEDDPHDEEPRTRVSRNLTSDAAMAEGERPRSTGRASQSREGAVRSSRAKGLLGDAS